MRASVFKTLFLMLVISLSLASPLFSCTAFRIKSQNGASIYCRTMEFAFPMDSAILIVPRKTTFICTTPEGQSGMRYQTQYGFVGLNISIQKSGISDGMNEEGLIVGALYLPGFAKYQPYDAQKKEKTLGSWELINFLLGTCSTVEQVKKVLPHIVVAEQPFSLQTTGSFSLPLHFYVSDAKGNALVIEYVNGQRQVYDNPFGALTNSPPFDWHLHNLGNYVKMSPETVSELKLKDGIIHAYGQGNGMQGIDGDYTSASRFVRACFFSEFAMSPKTAEEAVCLGFHVLNAFDIFPGAVKMPPKAANFGSLKSPDYETTQWVVIHDPQNLKTYFRSYESLQVEQVDLKKINFAKPGLLEIPMQRTFIPKDVTGNGYPISNASPK